MRERAINIYANAATGSGGLIISGSDADSTVEIDGTVTNDASNANLNWHEYDESAQGCCIGAGGGHGGAGGEYQYKSDPLGTGGPGI